MAFSGILSHTLAYSGIFRILLHTLAYSGNTLQYHAIPCNTMQYLAIRCNTVHYNGVVKRLLLGIKRQLWKNMTRNTHLNYKTLLGVARSSVQFEVSPSQEGLPKQVAQGVGSSLLRPPPLKQESIIPPLSSCCSTYDSPT